MIIANPDDVTPAVLAELERAPDARFREIIGAAVRHLHAFVREARLTEPEFQLACAYIARLGKLTTESHNEVVLAAGSLGVSSLVCLLNNGDHGRTPTTANLLGPFWRPGSPPMRDGDSIVRSATPGESVFATIRVEDREGRPVAGAEVDVWHASTEGFYENQDPEQAEMNLRGKFTTGDDGCVRFRTIKPAGYPIPVGGPVGELLRAQGRHNMRPAHIHLLVLKPGFKTQFTQLYASDDPHLDSDVQFAVTRALIADFVRHDAGPPPRGDASGSWYSLAHTLVVEPGEATVPRAPITAKSAQGRPEPVVLPAAAPREGGPCGR